MKLRMLLARVSIENGKVRSLLSDQKQQKVLLRQQQGANAIAITRTSAQIILLHTWS